MKSNSVKLTKGAVSRWISYFLGQFLISLNRIQLSSSMKPCLLIRKFTHYYYISIFSVDQLVHSAYGVYIYIRIKSKYVIVIFTIYRLHLLYLSSSRSALSASMWIYRSSYLNRWKWKIISKVLWLQKDFCLLQRYHCPVFKIVIFHSRLNRLIAF